MLSGAELLRDIWKFFCFHFVPVPAYGNFLIC